MTLTLSCADYTWPAIPHRTALDLIAALGFDGVDIGYFEGRSHIRPERVAGDIPRWAGLLHERCAARNLAVADVFAQTGGFTDRAVNHPDASTREASEEFFSACLDFARLVGSPGLTILPGVVFDGEPREYALERAAEGLRRRVEWAGAAGLRLSVEPHVDSVIDRPELTAQLLELVPGLRLTLDYGHFVCAGSTDADVEPLLAAAAHVQCRGAAPGMLQASLSGANTIDFPRMVRGLVAHGYQAYLATEYVWATWQRCNEVDNLTETVALRDLLRKEAGGSDPHG